VPQDKIQAYMWFTLASTRLFADDMRGAVEAIVTRDALAKTMSADEIAEGERRAKTWTPK
jgi:hypothetical protein